MTTESGRKLASLICSVVVALTVTGFFIGLQSPMNPFEKAIKGGVSSLRTFPEASSATQGSNGNVLAATDYRDIGEATRKRSLDWRTSLVDLKSKFDPLAEVKVTPEQKAFALALREQNRAFNGAPPTVPHPIDQMSTQTCMACHGEGMKTESLRISKMSHQFLENCTQCHVENGGAHETHYPCPGWRTRSRTHVRQSSAKERRACIRLVAVPCPVIWVNPAASLRAAQRGPST